MKYNFFFCLLCLSLTTSLAEDKPHANKINNATELSGLEEQHNTINYNTSQKDGRKIENVVGNLAHENTHKAISETKFAKKHINKDQEESVVRQVEWTAKHASKIAKAKHGANAFKPTKLNDIEWNKQNRDALKANNQRLASVDPEGVKASPWLLGDGSVFAKNMNPLEEQAFLKQSQEERLAKKASGEPIYEYGLPVVGSLLESGDAIAEGDLLQAAKMAAFGLLEGLPSGMLLGMAQKGLNVVGKGFKLIGKPVIGKTVGVGVKASTKMISQFSGSTIDDAVAYAMKNKATHVFGKLAHNLDPLVVKLGGQENTFRAVLNAANGKLSSSGIFSDILVNVGGYNVMIRGSVINGIPKIGTMFIP